MGKRGPAPTPPALSLLRGHPGRRPRNRCAPTPPAGVPSPPEHLSEVALAEWRRVVPDLEAAGLLTHLDRAALSAYCATWGRVVELERALTTERVVMKTKKGYPVLNPTFTALQSQYKQLMAFLTEFGMTPSSRSRIQVEKPAPESALEAFRRKHQDP